MKKLPRVKEMAKAGAIALTCAGLVASVAAACTKIAHGASNQASFTITNTISSSATEQSPALLYPGVQDYLWYTAHNPLKVPITVRSLSITSVNAPAGCPTTNLNYSSTTFTGTLLVPAQGTNSVPVPISLIETHHNQDSCEHTTFGFTFQGSATFSIVDPTKTFVTSSHDPAVIGQSVTYMATVISGDGSGNQHETGSPTGTVSFRDGSTTICANVPVSSGPFGTSIATCTPPMYLLAGLHPITAAYTNTDGNFSDSTSPVFIQVVQSARKSTVILTSWPNPSVLGFPVALTASVFGTPPVPSGSSPSGTVSIFSGTPITAHVLLATETLGASAKVVLTTSTLPIGADNLFAVYNGDANYAASTSPVIVQVVLAKPGHCDDPYNDWFYGSPGQPNIQGSSGNNFFWVPNGSFHVSASNGDNCFWGGDGNNAYTGGNGDNGILVGNGSDDVQVGDGTNQITLGGGNDTVTVGDGNANHVVVGNGNDDLTFGKGSSNQVILGSGADVVSVAGSQDTVSGTGSDTVYLGSGTGNTFVGAPHQSDVCHLPAPPSSWHGSPASYLHDTLTNCTVVSP
jgi:hypothetical protein